MLCFIFKSAEFQYPKEQNSVNHTGFLLPNSTESEFVLKNKNSPKHCNFAQLK